MSDAILTVRDLSVTYDGKPALEQVGTAIRPGRITAIIGPSGCGKSTLLKALNRSLELEPGAAVSGSVLLGDREIGAMAPEELRRRVGMVFQTPTPFPMSIYKNMTYAPLYYGTHDKKALEKLTEDCLRDCGLWEEVKEELHKSALKLSGGQQQRLCIARALTAGPEVLLLDEPCSALDVRSTQVIEELLTRLKDKYTIVIVTHNLFQAKRIADDCIFMLNGRIAEQGPAQQLFEQPEQQATRDYLQGVYA